MAPEGRGERLPFALRYGSLEPLFWSVSRLCERFVSGRLGLVFQHFWSESGFKCLQPELEGAFVGCEIQALLLLGSFMKRRMGAVNRSKCLVSRAA